MNKRGISEVVSYVLLIVIAMALAAIVYTFLKVYVPKEKPECKEGINIIVNDISCTNNGAENVLDLVLENKGLFEINKAYLRIGKDAASYKEDIPAVNPVNLIDKNGVAGLNPGELSNLPPFNLPSAFNTPGEYMLEIQPAYTTIKGRKEVLSLCSPITLPITCTP